jgi:hypothetical protein
MNEQFEKESENAETLAAEMEQAVDAGNFDEKWVRVEPPPRERRSISFAIRLTSNEATQFGRSAQRRGLTLAEYIRKVLRAAEEGQMNLDNAEALADVRSKARELSEAVNRLAKV